MKRIRTKLVFLLLAVTLIPVVPFYFGAEKLVERVFELGFNERFETAIEGAAKVSRQLFFRYREETLACAVELSGAEEVVAQLADGPASGAVLAERTEKLGICRVDLYDAGGDLIESFARGEIDAYPDPEAEILEQLERREEANLLEVSGPPRYIPGYAPVLVDGEMRGFLVVTRFLEPEFAATAERIVEANKTFKTLHFYRDEVEGGLLYFFILSYAVVVGLVTGIGLWVSRWITRPLLELVEGTQKVASGDWTYRLAVSTRDEVGQLVEAFNRMVGRIEETTERATREAAERRLAEEELQTAHDMQMGLMPEGSPRIEGLDIAGRCLPASHVGGDFFQYFERDGRLSICLADVTGHAMAAAIPVVMFSGVLESEMHHGESVEKLFGHLSDILHRENQPGEGMVRLFRNLNRTLYRSLSAHTFVCLVMGEFELAGRTLRVANSGCPYPYHYSARSREVVELQIDAYPLGIRSETVYQTIETELAPGDRVVFCSDGIIEAANSAQELFGFERTADAVREGCDAGQSASALLDHLIGSVGEFAGDVPQGDDITCVVLHREG